MNYRRWTLIGTVAAIVAVIWLIESDRMMGPILPSGSADLELSEVLDKAGKYPEAKELVGLFQENFKQFEKDVPAEVAGAGPA